MDAKLQTQIRFLKIYSAVLSILLTAVVIYGFTWAGEKVKFDEIDVGRINIVEKDGTVKMVISNKERAPDAIIGGKAYPRQGGNSPGIIFFNDKGDECAETRGCMSASWIGVVVRSAQQRSNRRHYVQRIRRPADSSSVEMIGARIADGTGPTRT